VSPNDCGTVGRAAALIHTCAPGQEEMALRPAGAAQPAGGTGSSPGIDVSRNRYCGPFALAYLLGLDSTAEASRLLREVSRQQQIRGVSSQVMLETLRSRGMRPTETGEFSKEEGQTLARWLKGRRGGLYLVGVTGHFLVVDGHRIFDNAHPSGARRKNWPHRRARVRSWWRFR
jgi:hypothetical protein